MKKSFTAFCCVVALVAICPVLCSIGQQPESEAKTTDGGEAADLREQLRGAWTIAEPANANGGQEVRQLKFWGDKHWTISISDAKSGKVIFHHGGTYTLDGDKYEETITFAAESTAEMIGQKFRFTISVKDGVYKQVGDGNNFSETWKRLE